MRNREFGRRRVRPWRGLILRIERAVMNGRLPDALRHRPPEPKRLLDAGAIGPTVAALPATRAAPAPPARSRTASRLVPRSPPPARLRTKPGTRIGKPIPRARIEILPVKPTRPRLLPPTLFRPRRGRRFGARAVGFLSSRFLPRRVPFSPLPPGEGPGVRAGTSRPLLLFLRRSVLPLLASNTSAGARISAVPRP